MKIVLDEWFSLPRLGMDVFTKLVREAGLEYDKGKGFRATARTDLVTVTSVLQSALREETEVEVRCFICGEPVGCSTCVYSKVCDRRRISPRCICEKCKNGKDAFALYSIRFAELLGD